MKHPCERCGTLTDEENLEFVEWKINTEDTDEAFLCPKCLARHLAAKARAEKRAGEARGA